MREYNLRNARARKGSYSGGSGGGLRRGLFRTPGCRSGPPDSKVSGGPELLSNALVWAEFVRPVKLSHY